MDVPGIPHLHRTAIRIGGAASGLSAAVFLIFAALTRDHVLGLNALAPLLVAISCWVMLRKNWLRAEIVLALAAMATVISFKVFGGEASSTPAAIGVVAIVSVGILFVDEAHQRNYLALGVLALFMSGVVWQGWNTHAMWLGTSGALSGGVAMHLFSSMRNAAVASDRRYRFLVERMPVPLIEHDWTSVRDWVEELRAQGVADIETYLDDYPETLERLVARVQLRSANSAMLAVEGGTGSRPQIDVSIDDLLPFLRREIVDMFNAVEPRPSEHRVVRTDGSVQWLRFHAADLEDGEIPGVDRVISATDITELKEVQAQLGEQVRSKDEFVAAVSHELRTPLTAVLGFAEVLVDTAEGLTADERDMLRHLHTQASDMSHIVEDLLVAARAEIGNVVIDAQLIDLVEVATAVTTNLSARIKIIERARPMVIADRVRVSQILRNLVTNAVRYGGSDRSIHVMQIGDTAVIEVRDDGAGVSPHQRERIFEPYTRAHDRPGMTLSVGLGLAVSRQLAELMGGTLEYQRTPGYSIFRLAFPVASTQAEVA